MKSFKGPSRFIICQKWQEIGAICSCCQHGTTLFFCFIISAERNVRGLFVLYLNVTQSKRPCLQYKSYCYWLQILDTVSFIKAELCCVPGFEPRCIPVTFYTQLQWISFSHSSAWLEIWSNLSSLWKFVVVIFCLNLPLLQKYRHVNFVIPGIHALRRKLKHFRDQGKTERGKGLDTGPFATLLWFQFSY